MKLISLTPVSSYDYKNLHENIFKIYLRENITQTPNAYEYDQYTIVQEITQLDIAGYIEENFESLIILGRDQDELNNKQKIIENCKTTLSNTDYQVLKCVENFMLGSVLPYDFSQILSQRTEIRDTINNLELDASETNSLESVAKRKIIEMSAICQTTITNGIDYNDEHYRLNTTDQINLTSLYSLAQLGQSVPYHADGQVCRIYTPEEMIGLAQAGTQWIIYHTTYFNLLKHQILEMSTVEEVEAVTYGMELKPEYQSILNAITA